MAEIKDYIYKSIYKMKIITYMYMKHLYIHVYIYEKKKQKQKQQQPLSFQVLTLHVIVSQYKTGWQLYFFTFICMLCLVMGVYLVTGVMFNCKLTFT